MSYVDMGGGKGSEMANQLTSPRGLVAAFGFGVSLLGLVLQWSQGLDDWGFGPDKIKDVNRLGMYTLFMLAVGGMNLVSYLKGRPELLWAGLVVYITTMDVNVCAADALRRKDKHWLTAAYGLAMGGTALTFSVVDFRLKLTKMFYVPVALAVLLLIGSILIWSAGNACSDDRNSTNIWANNQPAPPTTAALLAVVYIFSAVTSYTPGLELVFMFAALRAYSYRPFGWRCTDDVCRGGVTLTFITLLLIVAFHLVVSCKPTKMPTPAAIKVVSKPAFQVLCIVGTLVGAIMLWSDNYDASYSWAAVTMVVVTVLMLLVELFGHFGAAVAGLCFLASVIDVEANLVNVDGKTLHRVGYILMLLFGFLSLLALPCEWTAQMSLSEVDRSLRPFLYAGAAAFAAVVFLWSETVYEGQLGFVALVITFCAIKKFDLGFQWAYFLALQLIVQKTPFTSFLSGAEKVAEIIAGFALIFFVHLHVERFGAVAFDSLRLFTESDGSEGGGGFMDSASRPLASNPNENSSAQPQGERQVEYGTVAPASAMPVEAAE